MKTVSKYMTSHCENKGVIKMSENLTKSEKIGRAQIKDGILNKGWMLYSKDKSGKMCLDTVTNYRECMEEHVSSDPKVTAKTV